jgi:hypothetical protein
LVAKEESHKTLYEWINGIQEEKRVERVTGIRKVRRETWIYHWVNEVPIRDQTDKHDEPLIINFCEITIVDESGRRKYHNAFVTNHMITAGTVEEITAAGRVRWKVENENNNTLKNQGYHLEHNFGHGKKNLSSLLAVFNILAFAVHTILEMMNETYQRVREKIGRRDEMFNGIRYLLSRFLFKSFTSLMEFMVGDKKTKFDYIPI